jgi:hypothetical protein
MTSNEENRAVWLQEFPEMKVLMDKVDCLPCNHRASLQPIVRELTATLTRRVRALRLVLSAIDEMRLDFKYVQFDLDATRSERDSYQRRIVELESE